MGTEGDMMRTRCPGCQTVFRVTPEQLKARAGKVRCGQCQTVFNALDSLLEDLNTTPPVSETANTLSALTIENPANVSSVAVVEPPSDISEPEVPVDATIEIGRAHV